MSEPKLPPGPWRVVEGDAGNLTLFDRDGLILLEADPEESVVNGAVFRAVAALPQFIVAARAMVYLFDSIDRRRRAEYGYTPMEVEALRDALARIDGGGEEPEATIGDHNREAVYDRFIDAGWADDMYPGETVDDDQLQAFLEHERRERGPGHEEERR